MTIHTLTISVSSVTEQWASYAIFQVEDRKFSKNEKKGFAEGAQTRSVCG